MNDILYLTNQTKEFDTMFITKQELKTINVKEVFEEGVVIADVVTDEKNINQEALDHLETMGKGDEE